MSRITSALTILAGLVLGLLLVMAYALFIGASLSVGPALILAILVILELIGVGLAQAMLLWVFAIGAAIGVLQGIAIGLTTEG